MNRGQNCLLTVLVVFFVALFIISGCSSKLIVKTDPSEANVHYFLLNSDESSKILLGKTPMEITDRRVLSEKYIYLVFEKDGFNTKTVLVPTPSFSSNTVDIAVKMKQGDKTSEKARNIVNYLFNARKFVVSKNYNKAYEMIDQALKIDAALPEAYALRGTIHYLQRNYTKAAGQWETALKFDPKYSEAVEMLNMMKTRKLIK